MIDRVILSMLLAGSGAVNACAEDLIFPSLHDVTGVVDGDGLNIRSEPSSTAPILGSFASDKRGIEVLRLSVDSHWARVGLGETSGWVATRYLTERIGQDPEKLPSPMRCYGVEPFWGLHFTPDGAAQFDQPPAPEQHLDLIYESVPEGKLAQDILAKLGGENTTATLFLRRERCSDGMSEREFALSVRVLLESGTQNSAYSGCCSLIGD